MENFDKRLKLNNKLGLFSCREKYDLTFITVSFKSSRLAHFHHLRVNFHRPLAERIAWQWVTQDGGPPLAFSRPCNFRIVPSDDTDRESPLPLSFFTFISGTPHRLAYQCRLVPVTPNTGRGEEINIDRMGQVTLTTLAFLLLHHPQCLF